MTIAELLNELKTSQEFFERSSRPLSEEDSAFRPVDGMLTAAQQVAHIAQTVDWFVDGVQRPEGFDLDFEKHMKVIEASNSLEKSREWVRNAFAAARQYFSGLSDADLERSLPPGPVMGGAPVGSVVYAIIEHTAHHRGALSVYSRLLGKVPPMPYGEM